MMTEYNFKAGELTVISVRSSVEAYIQLRDFVFEEGLEKRKTVAVYLFSKEREVLIKDLISKRANVSTSKAYAGDLSNREFLDLHFAGVELKESEIYFSATEMIIPADILGQCKRVEPKNGAVDIIFIEALSLRKRFKADREVLEANIGALKRIAKELNVAIVTFALFGKKEAKRLSGEVAE